MDASPAMEALHRLDQYSGRFRLRVGSETLSRQQKMSAPKPGALAKLGTGELLQGTP